MSPQWNTHRLVVRSARPDDAAPLAHMFERCSAQTRFQRFHGRLTNLPAAYLRRCLGGEQPPQRTRVAEMTGSGEDVGLWRCGDGAQLVGLASLGPVFAEPQVEELGVLVEDRWQGLGIGAMLVSDLAVSAWADGVALIRCELCRSRPALLAHLVAQGHVVSTHSSGCDVTLMIGIDSLVAGARPRQSLVACGSPSVMPGSR